MGRSEHTLLTHIQSCMSVCLSVALSYTGASNSPVKPHIHQKNSRQQLAAQQTHFKNSSIDCRSKEDELGTGSCASNSQIPAIALLKPTLCGEARVLQSLMWERRLAFCQQITRNGFEESTDSARFFILPEHAAIVTGICSSFGIFNCFGVPHSSSQI